MVKPFQVHYGVSTASLLSVRVFESTLQACTAKFAALYTEEVRTNPLRIFLQPTEVVETLIAIASLTMRVSSLTQRSALGSTGRTA